MPDNNDGLFNFTPKIIKINLRWFKKLKKIYCLEAQETHRLDKIDRELELMECQSEHCLSAIRKRRQEIEKLRNKSNPI